jgi:hypothetical protein
MDAPHCGLDRQLSLAKVETGLAGSQDFFPALS